MEVRSSPRVTLYSRLWSSVREVNGRTVQLSVSLSYAYTKK